MSNQSEIKSEIKKPAKICKLFGSPSWKNVELFD